MLPTGHSGDSMRILGLDMGHKRIGVAISDTTGAISFALCVIERTNRDTDIKAVCEIIRTNGVGEIVVGLPLNMDGTPGGAVQEVEDFAVLLSRQTDLPIKRWDERLSSVAAEKSLINCDLTRRKRKLVIDKVAAQIILQGYLDSIGKDA
jgi:putative Holliday junction resolvase